MFCGGHPKWVRANSPIPERCMPQAATDNPIYVDVPQRIHTEHACKYLILMVSHHLAHVKLTILAQMKQQTSAHAFRYDRHRVSAAELRYQGRSSWRLSQYSIFLIWAYHSVPDVTIRYPLHTYSTIFPAQDTPVTTCMFALQYGSWLREVDCMPIVK